MLVEKKKRETETDVQNGEEGVDGSSDVEALDKIGLSSLHFCSSNVSNHFLPRDLNPLIKRRGHIVLLEHPAAQWRARLSGSRL
jgi:hypothetical protein